MLTHIHNSATLRSTLVAVHRFASVFQDAGGLNLASIQAECCRLLNEVNYVSGILNVVGTNPPDHVVMAISTVGHCLMRHTKVPFNKLR